MKAFAGVLIAAALVWGGAVAIAQGTAQTGSAHAGRVTARAHADIKGEGITGSAELIERTYETGGMDVDVTVRAKGLKPGLHGVHLHAVGTCEPPFSSAGGHFDPGPAGNTDPDANHPYHMGDLPNMRVGADGTGTLHWRTSRVTLSEGPLSLLDSDGAAVIVHANQDQYTTGEPKSGVSGGPRAACGVIQKR
jgi:Cu-Zn family superoxide dismutase